TVKTGRGFHVYGRLIEETYANLDDGELRADSRHYVVLPPSLHPDGILYHWTVPLGERELPELPASLSQRQHHTQAHSGDSGKPSQHSKHSKHIACATSAIASPLPSGPGQRNQCIFQLARRLKAPMPDATPAELRVIVREWHR